MKMQLRQIERLNKEIEVRHSRRENLDIRNKWLQAKKIKHYQSEYDRIRSHMANSTLPFTTQHAVRNRKNVLEKLGARAFHFMQN